jgi:hypothetical protein
MREVVLGLDLDGVVIDLTYLEEEVSGRHLREEDIELAHPGLLPPVLGVRKVLKLGVVEAIVTKRTKKRPIEEWFTYWFGGLMVPVYCVGPNGDKAEKCEELGITVFVDDDYFIMAHLKSYGILGLWFTVKKDKDLYEFLRREGIL